MTDMRDFLLSHWPWYAFTFVTWSIVWVLVSRRRSPVLPLIPFEGGWVLLVRHARGLLPLVGGAVLAAILSRFLLRSLDAHLNYSIARASTRLAEAQQAEAVE